MRIKNACPYTITIIQGPSRRKFAPVATQSQYGLSCSTENVQHVSNVPVHALKKSKPQWPEREEGVYWIVPAAVAGMIPKDREDLLVPVFPVHNRNGQLVGYKGLANRR